MTKPTGQAIFQLFAYVQVVVLKWPNGQRQRNLGRPLTYEQQRVLRELGFGEEIYLSEINSDSKKGFAIAACAGTI